MQTFENHINADSNHSYYDLGDFFDLNETRAISNRYRGHIEENYPKGPEHSHYYHPDLDCEAQAEFGS